MIILRRMQSNFDQEKPREPDFQKRIAKDQFLKIRTDFILIRESSEQQRHAAEVSIQRDKYKIILTLGTKLIFMRKNQIFEIS